MALRWIEGFEGFGDTLGVAPQPTGVLARKGYTVNNEANFDIEAGYWSSGFSLELNNAGDYLHSPKFSSLADRTTVIAFATVFSNLGAYKFISLYDDSDAESVNLRLRADGEIDVYCASTLLGTTSGAAIVANVWRYIELKVYTSGSAGTVDIHIDQSSVISLSGLDTYVSSAYQTSWRLWALDSGQVKFDHLHFLDGSGAKNNDFLGLKQVRTVFPGAVGDYEDWTPSAGDNYECVDEDVIDDLTSYVSTNVSGRQDLYGYPDITALQMPEGIAGVQVNTDCARTGGTTFGLLVVALGAKLYVMPPAVDGAPPTYPLYTVDHSDFQTITSVMESNADEADWTRANFNTTQFGVKIG